ncbi:MAG: winged helix-turn-helix domain-containing protein [bacterium]|nr:winged helix-turn-helix domain-containing protein [bacterium]
MDKPSVFRVDMTESSRKNFYRLERTVRGFSNHRRIEILLLLREQRNISVSDIAKELNILLKTASAHVNRLALAGLVWKHSDGSSVICELSELGEKTVDFLEDIAEKFNKK